MKKSAISIKVISANNNKDIKLVIYDYILERLKKQ